MSVLFPGTRAKVTPTLMMAATRRFYYTPSLTYAFATAAKLARASKSKYRRSVETWLLQQDAYTIHRPTRKTFPRNPYMVINMMDVWECDLMDMRSLRKYNEKFKYLLSVKDVFSKY